MKLPLFTTLVVAFYAIAAAAIAAGPLAAIEGTDFADFGRYPAKEAKTASFQIVNKGDAPIKILGVRNVCDCVEAHIQEQELPPGGKFTFTAKILPDSIYGQYSKPVYIKTDDPTNKFLSIKLSGYAIPILKTVLEPEIYAGHIKLDVPWAREIDLEATDDGVEAGNPNIESSLPAELSIEKTSSRNFTLKFKLNPRNNALGPFLSKIQIPIKNPGGWKPLLISISGFAGAEIAATPSKIFLSKASDKPVESEIELRLISPDSKPLKIEDLSFSSPEGVAVALSEKSPGILVAKIVVPPAMGGGVIEFKAPNAKPLSIPISGR